MEKDINHILESIKNESKNFLENNISLQTYEIKTFCNKLNHHTSIITLEDDTFLCRVIISIEKELFEAIFSEFIAGEIEESQRDELAIDLSNEIINIIVGLSTRNFPKKFSHLILSTPLYLTKKEVRKIIEKKQFQSFEIITSLGSFNSYIIMDKNG